MRLIILLLAASFALPALSAGHGEAQRAYDRGDYLNARRLVIPQAQAGIADAQFLLGQMYANGDGVLQDYVQAHKWLNLAAASGHRNARRVRDTISNRMTSAQLAEAQSLARAWRPSHNTSTASNTHTTRSNASTAAHSTRAASASPTRTARTAPRSRRHLVRDVQTMLNELGYDAGPADGLMGQRTRNAIRAYQLHSGLSTTGQPSADLHHALTADLGYAHEGTTTEKLNPPQPAATQTQAASSNTPIHRQNNQRTTASSRPIQQSSTHQSSLTQPGDEPVQRLRAIIDAGEQRGAVQGSFLNRLRGLVESHDFRWRQLIAEDAFSDGDFSRSPRWDVLSGQFWVHRQDGLRTQVQPIVQTNSGGTSSQRPSGKDIGIALLGALLQQQVGGGGNTGSTSLTPTDAQIRLGASIPASFAVELKLLSGANSGRLEIGVYQQGRSDTGYRVAYLPGATQGLELSRIRTGQESILEVSGGPLKLEDGATHTVLWTRDRDGYMRVSVDGRELMSVSDRSLRGRFDGFLIINRGGDYGIRSVRLLGEP